ncbi:D-alanyl-D-alanine carboxypeptidase [Myxosarcina sp. GI1(2024)]
MLDLVSLGLIELIDILSSPTPLEPLPSIAWEKTAIFNLPLNGRSALVDRTIEAYLKSLAEGGSELERQGLWLQTDWEKIADNQGTVPVTAASLTKIATMLAALDKWGANHQFETKIYATGALDRGTLAGDLIIEGDGDPFLVWEEAIALGNALNDLGINEVAGNLIVTNSFYLNYESNSQTAGELLQQALNSRLWTDEVTRQYLTLPDGTPRPQLEMAGKVKLKRQIPDFSRLLLRHQSLPLKEILKQMNIYSNNNMAQILADSAGGASQVARDAARLARVPQTEIQLTNGSGLGVDNRISPRAVCQMLSAIARNLESDALSLSDVFPVAGRDLAGTIANRNLPRGTSLKTGTLARVSALAGVIPTSDRGSIWFAIINQGDRLEDFRASQDRLLQNLVQYWQLEREAPQVTYSDWYLGDPGRNSYGFD